MNKYLKTYYQKSKYSEADEKRFIWQTQNEIVNKMELSLLASIKDALIQNKCSSVLEIGCGDAGNIYNLRTLLSGHKCCFTGIDYSEEKIRLATKNCPFAKFHTMDARYLNFPKNSFDLVFLRDVLHHVNEKQRVLMEAKRVAKKKVIVIEANGENWLMKWFGKLMKLERDVLNSTTKKICNLLNNICKIDFISYKYAEPNPYPRLYLHYLYGMPKFSHFFLVKYLTVYLNKILCRQDITKWGYVVYECKVK